MEKKDNKAEGEEERIIETEDLEDYGRQDGQMKQSLKILVLQKKVASQVKQKTADKEENIEIY